MTNLFGGAAFSLAASPADVNETREPGERFAGPGKIYRGQRAVISTVCWPPAGPVLIVFSAPATRTA